MIYAVSLFVTATALCGNTYALIINIVAHASLIYNNLISFQLLEALLYVKAQQFHESGKKIILTSGCFDILHVGHLENLKIAKSLGDILVVCLSNDEQVRKLKGSTRPVNNYEDRINLFKTISYVDYVILYAESNIETEETLDQIMKTVRPAIWAKGDEYIEAKIREKHPSLDKIVLIPTVVNKSTTNIIKKINLNTEAK